MCTFRLFCCLRIGFNFLFIFRVEEIPVSVPAPHSVIDRPESSRVPVEPIRAPVEPIRAPAEPIRPPTEPIRPPIEPSRPSSDYAIPPREFDIPSTGYVVPPPSTVLSSRENIPELAPPAVDPIPVTDLPNNTEDVPDGLRTPKRVFFDTISFAVWNYQNIFFIIFRNCIESDLWL